MSDSTLMSKIPPPPERTVYILGAGFSHAISAAMPLLTQLSAQVMAKYAAIDQVPPQIKDLIRTNFEEALSYLAQPKPWLRESEVLRHRALYLELAQVVAAVLNEAAYGSVLGMGTEPPTWLVSLILRWHSDRSTVITLNYDTLIEEVAIDIPLKEHDGAKALGVQSLYPPFFTDAASRTAMILQGPPIETFQLLKLHGSTNWFYSGREAAFGETIYYVSPRGPTHTWNDTGTEAYKIGIANIGDKYPFIVPPVFDKAILLTHESIRSVWFKAGDALSRATKLVFVGYSLPPSDRTMKHFLTSTLAPTASIEIVDLADKIDHYKSALPGWATRITQLTTGVDCVEKFVRTR